MGGLNALEDSLDDAIKNAACEPAVSPDESRSMTQI
jgi:hypothetical protein